MFDPVPAVTTPRGLAYLLRHQELWPKNFRWSYTSCDDCGMALLFDAIGRDLPRSTEQCVDETAEILGLQNWAAWSIFAMLGVEPVDLGNLQPGVAFKRRTVTPEMVATALEAAAMRQHLDDVVLQRILERASSC